MRRNNFEIKSMEDQTVDDILDYFDVANKVRAEYDRVKFQDPELKIHITPAEYYFTKELIEEAKVENVRRQILAVKTRSMEIQQEIKRLDNLYWELVNKKLNSVYNEK